MEEVPKKKYIYVIRRKKPNTVEVQKKKFKVVVKQRPVKEEVRSQNEVIEVEVNVQAKPRIGKFHQIITLEEEKPKRTRRSKAKAEDSCEKPKKTTRTRKKKETSDSEKEAKPKRRSTTKKAETKKNTVPVYDPDPFLESEVSMVNIARCLRKSKDIIRGRL